jgi:hypothetical protein
MHSSYHKELHRTLRKLEMAANRIQELETFKDSFPVEVEQAQKLVTQLVRTEVYASARQCSSPGAQGGGARPDTAGSKSEASTASMQMIEMLPTPRNIDSMMASPSLLHGAADATLGQATLEAALSPGGQNAAELARRLEQDPGQELRIQPGESIDLKLREWIDASERLLDLAE